MIYVQDPDLTIHVGDVRDVLPTLPAESVDCVATSPPFYALRDYGTGEWEGGDPDCDHRKQVARAPHERKTSTLDGGTDTIRVQEEANVYRDVCGKCGAHRVDRQIGLESTPDLWAAELVAVFRECRRILRPHGTLWVECGDSYGSGGHNGKGYVDGGEQTALIGQAVPRLSPYKPKDLMGTPWLLAFALRGPWYIGRIKKDIDRVWLAAMLDAEGCIYVHRRKAGESNYARYTRKDGSVAEYERKNDSYGPAVQVANVNRAVVEHCQAIYGCGSISSSDRQGNAGRRRQTIHRWSVLGNQARDLLREVYPHLIAKQHEARIALACPSTNGNEHHAALKLLHAGSETTVDGPKPDGLWEPGFYLRQCITWFKPNCMPESVRDRCTTAHSYVFLFSKQPRYWFDADAIAEPAAWERWGDQTVPKHEGTPTASGWISERSRHELAALGGRTTNGQKGRTDERRGFDNRLERVDGMKNARSVWTIPTRGYSGAHFATWPETLAERIILAGCPEWVCGTCGKPRERLVEREQPPAEAFTKAAEDSWANNAQRNGLGASSHLRVPGARMGMIPPPRMVGWSDCGHGNYRPGVILDPFGGAGTTALVARRLGRRSVLVELNQDYARMAAERCQQLSLLADSFVADA